MLRSGVAHLHFFFLSFFGSVGTLPGAPLSSHTRAHTSRLIDFFPASLVSGDAPTAMRFKGLARPPPPPQRLACAPRCASHPRAAPRGTPLAGACPGRAPRRLSSPAPEKAAAALPSEPSPRTSAPAAPPPRRRAAHLIHKPLPVKRRCSQRGISLGWRAARRKGRPMRRGGQAAAAARVRRRPIRSATR